MISGKQTDGLMRHLRDNKGISISGSKQKKELLNMGYYHGYKGYRFIRSSSHPIPYTDFEEIVAVYNFDQNLKAIFYPHIIAIETALKNYTIDTLVSFGNLDLDYAFRKFLDDYKSEQVGSKEYNRKMKDRLNLKKKIHNEINYKYPGNQVITHFLHNGDGLPLWAIFEILDMGNFGLFLKCLNEPIRIKNSQNLKLTHASIQQDGKLVQDIIFCLKDLRNAVAHNNVIFDCRFSKGTNATNLLKSYVTLETGINNVEFIYVVDYFILSVLLLKKIGRSKTELKRIIKNFREEVESLRSNIPVSVWNSIMGTDINSKLSRLESYV